MPFAGRWMARGFDALAVVVVLYALFYLFVRPHMAREAAAPAPPITLAGLDGRRFSLAAQRGRVVFLDFWTSWCEPCKQALPLVERYARSHPDVDVIAIDVGETAATASEFARAYRLSNVVLDPDQIAAHAYGVGGFPTMVVIDPAGRLRDKWIGYNPAIEEAMADARERYGKPARAVGDRWGTVPADAATSARCPKVEPPPQSAQLGRPTASFSAKRGAALFKKRLGAFAKVGRPDNRAEVQRFDC